MANMRRPNIEELMKEVGWIACSDRLPDKDDAYLAATCNGAVDVHWFHKDRKQWGDGHWQFYEDGYIVYWMPLPKHPSHFN